MAKFLKIGSTGLPTEEAAVSTSAGAGDAGKIPELDAAGKLDSTMMPAGFGSDSSTFTAGEAISAGHIIYFNGSGEMMKADANDVAKSGVAFVLAGVSAAATGTGYFEGTITGLSGLTPGAKYFLSNATPGAIALYSALTFASGDIIQMIGTATSATTLSFEPQTPIVKI
jgi:hypothetical protein